jgi:hypothetical protein
VSYRFEWIAAPVFLGALGLLLIGPLAVVAVLVVALVALAAVIALTGGVLALPYLLVRSVHRRLAERRRATGTTVPVSPLQQGAHHEPVAA